jgi:uncharacterized protein with HEPN domain
MAFLWDMLDAARTAVAFVQDTTFDDFLTDRKTRNAVERNLEILGEAAGRVSTETRDQYPDIPWRSIVGLRNIIIHEYGEIRYETVWNICKKRLPSLVGQLQEMGAEELPDDEPADAS